MQAYRDSAEWMMRSPQEAAKLAVKFALDGQNEAANLEVIKMRNASSISSTTQQKGLGAFDMTVIQKGANAYKAFGLIQRDLKVADVISQDLLPSKK